jgi:putative transposase
VDREGDCGVVHTPSGLDRGNLCLRQPLLVPERRTPRPRLHDSHRRWILACRWLPRWREFLLVVQPDTVLRWYRQGWTAYWRWRSRRRGRGGRPRLPGDFRALIRRMSAEILLWGQRRVQAELARLGIPVSARTVAKYMRRPYDGVPSPGWRRFLTRRANDIWACDFFGVRTVFFRTLYVFFAACSLMVGWSCCAHKVLHTLPRPGSVVL